MQMHEAIQAMLSRYDCQSLVDYENALREILQELALLGLWRSKFFEHAAFYGGTALRILQGLERFSEDLDFSLLKPDPDFTLAAYGEALQREIMSFGFVIEFEQRKRRKTTIDSAFLKSNTYKQLIVIQADPEKYESFHPVKTLKIKLEVDTDPPGGFETESRYLLQPVPFPVRAYTLPDLFAGKLHAVLCRRWKTRVKGRDWFDLVWYITHHPEVRLRHLELRMRQSGDFSGKHALSHHQLLELLANKIDALDINKARQEVSPFVRDKATIENWSKEMFLQIIDRIKPV
jgi:predicted nucleotidyltransferase component of viral defense system